MSKKIQRSSTNAAMKQYEKVYSTNDMDYPDDPETTRMATAVVIFCIFAGPAVLTSIMLIVIHAEAIDAFMKSVVIFLYWHPVFALILSLYTLRLLWGFVAMNKLLKR